MRNTTFVTRLASRVRLSQDTLLITSAYLAWASVTVAEVVARWGSASFWLTTGLLLAFGAVTVAMPRVAHGSRGVYLYLTTQTILVFAVMSLEARWGTVAILYFVLSVQAVLLLPMRRGLLWIGGLALLTTAAFVVGEGRVAGLLYGLVYAGGYYFFGAFGLTLVRAVTAQRRSEALLGELQATHRQLQEYAVRIQELAVSEERNRLAREMHDTLGHALTMSVVQLEGAQRLVDSDPERSTRIIGTVREELRGALAELRTAVAMLRMPLEAELPLDQSLARLAARFQEAGQLPVHLALTVEPSSFPAEHRLAFYRAAQEALTNIQKHAQAQQAWLTFATGEGRATLVVSDDGIGSNAIASGVGFGLRGIQERVAGLGGALQLDERPGGGTQMHFWLPLA
jgi:signal transduction histidine kinase